MKDLAMEAFQGEPVASFRLQREAAHHESSSAFVPVLRSLRSRCCEEGQRGSGIPRPLQVLGTEHRIALAIPVCRLPVQLVPAAAQQRFVDRVSDQRVCKQQLTAL
jgi:hypothetical protein